jgi:DNA mismatch endonuclease (patch repair protein)
MVANRRIGAARGCALRRALHLCGLRFRSDLRVDGVLWTRPDIVFPKARVAVFVDGCFWHRCPIHGTSPKANSEYWTPKLDRIVERDRETDAALVALGWTVVRV